MKGTFFSASLYSSFSGTELSLPAFLCGNVFHGQRSGLGPVVHRFRAGLSVLLRQQKNNIINGKKEKNMSNSAALTHTHTQTEDVCVCLQLNYLIIYE